MQGLPVVDYESPQRLVSAAWWLNHWALNAKHRMHAHLGNNMWDIKGHVCDGEGPTTHLLVVHLGCLVRSLLR